MPGQARGGCGQGAQRRRRKSRVSEIPISIQKQQAPFRARRQRHRRPPVRSLRRGCRAAGLGAGPCAGSGPRPAPGTAAGPCPSPPAAQRLPAQPAPEPRARRYPQPRSPPTPRRAPPVPSLTVRPRSALSGWRRRGSTATPGRSRESPAPARPARPPGGAAERLQRRAGREAEGTQNGGGAAEGTKAEPHGAAARREGPLGPRQHGWGVQPRCPPLKRERGLCTLCLGTSPTTAPEERSLLQRFCLQMGQGLCTASKRMFQAPDVLQ